MCKDTAFWCGMGAGLVVGAVIGMAVCSQRSSMKTCVGRTMQRMGTAMDNAADELKHAMR